MSEAIKVKGKDVGIGDWISVNIQGIMRMGRVGHLNPAESSIWRSCEIKTDAGDRLHFHLNSHEQYTIHTFVDDGDRNNDDVTNLILRTGQCMALKFARMSWAKLTKRSEFKYRARDGRLIFKDGSGILLNSDSSRTLFDAKGKELDWPRLLVRQ
jgi:hypothetical protein